LLEPSWCKNIKCTIARAAIANGNTKCNTKKRFKVALSTEKPPQTQVVIGSPTKGIADIKLVITVAPQKLICPQGSTYPKNPVPIITK